MVLLLCGEEFSHPLTAFSSTIGSFFNILISIFPYRQKDDPYNAIAAGFITGGVLAIRGGLSVAFKNAIIGGVILGLIEGVSTLITSFSMRQQYKFMEEEQKRQMEEAQRILRKGGNDPWAVDYNAEVAEINKKPTSAETLLDKAKSFSF